MAHDVQTHALVVPATSMNPHAVVGNPQHGCPGVGIQTNRYKLRIGVLQRVSNGFLGDSVQLGRHPV